MIDHFKIRSVRVGSVQERGPAKMQTKQIADHFKIRSVSDGSARGWGPARTKK